MSFPSSSSPASNAAPLGIAKRWIADATTVSARHPWIVVLGALLLAIVSSAHVVRDIAIDTDSAKLIAATVPWRERSARFDAAFPQRSDLIAVVLDGDTPEIAERAAALLTERLAGRSDVLRQVRRPDGGAFFDRNGLLFLEVDEVTTATEQLVSAQPLLGSLAVDPSVRGLMDTLQLALEGVRRGDAKLDRLAPGFVALAATLEGVVADRPTPLSWRSMLGGRAPLPRELRRFVLAQPVLDFSALQPGRRAADLIRATARDAGLDAAHGVRVRLTGSVPMADEEFVTLEEHAGRNAAVMLVALLVMVWLAVRSVRATVAIFVTLVIGLAITAAIGLRIYGALNLISVAFAVLFIGLGVDFGIQYAVSYRANAASEPDRPHALRRASLEVGVSLALAAIAIAAGFFAFEPTDYRGVSELGVIAGIGMVVAFVACVTLLPALLALLQVDGMPGEMGFRGLAVVDRFLIARRRAVLIGAAGIAVVAVAALPFVRFDFDPLNLRSPTSEAVATILDLSRDPQTTPNTIDVLTPTLDAARDVASRIAKLPEVAQVLTLASFVPRDQDAKLALIGDASLLLDPTLNPGTVKPAPDDAANVAAMRAAAGSLRATVAAEPDAPGAADATRVAAALEALAAGPAERRRLLDDALVPGLLTTLTQARSALQAAPVSLATLPEVLKADWITADGRARAEVYPREPAVRTAAAEADTLKRFIAAVRTVAPDATGTPISIQESAGTIIHAFAEAGAWALVAITVLLVAVLRRARDVLVTLASLLLGGLVTLALCVVFGIALNYENIIALPLLFGIGVAFNIYFVVAWRHGTRDLLQTSLARAVIFSALTTSTAFGSLWLSSHPGTASMGKLLALSLGCTLAAALLVLPALLGPPPAAAPRQQTRRPMTPLQPTMLPRSSRPSAVPALPRTWDGRLARWLVMPLRDTAVVPNHLTTLRLAIGVVGAWYLARGGYGPTNAGAFLIVLSNFVDHTDGELARISGKTSRVGHLYDLAADAIVTVLLFTCLGVGIDRAGLPVSATLLGAVAGIAVAAIFFLRMRIEALAGKAGVAQSFAAGFETEDVLYLLPLVTLFAVTLPFLVAAAIGAPLFASWSAIEWRRALQASRRQAT